MSTVAHTPPLPAPAWARARALAVGLWLGASILGALNQTVAPMLLGRSFDLALPHLKQGYVMFVKIPRTIAMHDVLRGDGSRTSIADIVSPRAYLYPRARIETDLGMNPDLLPQICRLHARRTGETTTFLVEEYRLLLHPERPRRTTALRCDDTGLIPVPPPRPR